MFVYGFAHPRSGSEQFLIRPVANAECMGRTLADFAEWADPEEWEVLVVDRAGVRRWRVEQVGVGVEFADQRQPGAVAVAEPGYLVGAIARISSRYERSAREPDQQQAQSTHAIRAGVRCGRERFRSSSSDRYRSMSTGRARGRAANGNFTSTARTTQRCPYRQGV